MNGPDLAGDERLAGEVARGVGKAMGEGLRVGVCPCERGDEEVWLLNGG